MEIRQFRVVIRATFFERTCRFYGESLGFPRLQSWDREDSRGALFQAGAGVVEIHGRPADADPRDRDEAYAAQGPLTKVTMTVVVSSAEQAYQECQFRDKNIPGGLRRAADGGLVFETHDPEGVRVHFHEART